VIDKIRELQAKEFMMIATEHQLERMAQLHQKALPAKLPEILGWDLACHHQSGPSPGGIYYEIVPLPNRRLLLLVGDASEGGPAGAVLVILAHTLLQACPLSYGTEQLPFCPMSENAVRPPHIILNHLGQALAASCLSGQYLTAFCGVLDVMEGELRYANAGHTPPLLWRNGTGLVESLHDGSGGPPLGVHRIASYHQHSVMLDRGDTLLLCSDHIAEVRNRCGEVFSRERLASALGQGARDGAEATVLEVRDGLELFLQGEGIEDDVTVIAAKRLS
jgi:sigma-B regulation protein RsbU (phosphoserine phosphatase)